MSWIRGAAVPFQQYRHLALRGPTSVQNCKSGQEIPADTGSALLHFIHSYPDGGQGLEVQVARSRGGRPVKVER